MCKMNLPSNIWILEYDRIDISEGIDFNGANGTRECIICHYWYFLNINFRFRLKVCDGCHDLMQKAWGLMVFQFFC